MVDPRDIARLITEDPDGITIDGVTYVKRSPPRAAPNPQSNMPTATIIKRPSSWRGPTNYAIDGYTERFRYVQGGRPDEQIGLPPDWRVMDGPRVINGHLCLVAQINGGFGFFVELSPEQVYG